jgi:hypothetical protein
MSNTLNTVLERLKAFAQVKLGELDGRLEEHLLWLPSAVEDVARQIAALGPAAKRQRLDAGGAARATAAAAQGEEEAEEQVGGPLRSGAVWSYRTSIALHEYGEHALPGGLNPPHGRPLAATADAVCLCRSLAAPLTSACSPRRSPGPARGEARPLPLLRRRQQPRSQRLHLLHKQRRRLSSPPSQRRPAAGGAGIHSRLRLRKRQWRLLTRSSLQVGMAAAVYHRRGHAGNAMDSRLTHHLPALRQSYS